MDLERFKQYPVPSVVADVEKAALALESRPASKLRVVTWNVWFDEYFKDARMESLVREVLSVAPDVACLQEVLPRFSAALRACGPLAALYDISPFDVAPYGVMILARRDLQVAFIQEDMPSMMGRTLLVASCQARCPGLIVATVHLESLNSERTRRAQLLLASERLLPFQRAVLCGDFNFDSAKTYGDWNRGAPARAPEELENCVLTEVLPDYVDAWPAVHGDGEGITFDGAANPLCVSDGDERMRYDRVMVRRGGLRLEAAALLGTAPINDAGVRPSDHFGVQVDLTLE